MRIVRNRRKYCIRIAVKIGIYLVCIIVGVLVGVFGLRYGNEKKMRQKRFYVYVLKEDVEAGSLLEAQSVEKVSVIKEQNSYVEKAIDDFVGKRVKQSLKKGCVLSECLLCGENDVGAGVRKVPFTYVRNTDALSKGEYIDVRISFPNGADFTVLGKKEVVNLDQNEKEGAEKLWLLLGEEEILRMSSAVVDAYLFEGAYLYAVLYMDSLQEETIVNYPVNDVVEELMKKNPNIIKIAQDKMTLELRSRIYENVPMGKEESERQKGSQKKESLLYFD